MVGTASIRTLAVKIETFTNEVCVPDFGLTFPVLAGNFLPFLSRTEVGGLIASFGHTLRARGCRCELIEKLPSVLLFETLLETYRYIALGIAGTSTLDHHHRLNMAGERITTWLQAPDTLAELHRCYSMTVAGMSPVVIPQTANEAPLEGTEVTSQGSPAQ